MNEEKKYFYLGKTRIPQGPVTARELKQLFTMGDFLYCSPGDKQWKSFQNNPPVEEEPAMGMRAIPPPLSSIPGFPQSATPSAAVSQSPPPLSPLIQDGPGNHSEFYYLGIDNQPHGPVTWEELEQRAGELNEAFGEFGRLAELQYRPAGATDWLVFKLAPARPLQAAPRNQAVVFPASTAAPAASLPAKNTVVKTEPGVPGQKTSEKQFERKLALLSGGSNGGMTITIIVINILAYIIIGLLGGGWFSVDDPGVYQQYGAGSAALIAGNGEWWRLVTSMFLHFGIIHLLCNMAALQSVGIFFEKLEGRFIYIIIYFTCGVFSSFTSTAWDGAALTAGASGAIFGIYGALLGVAMRSRGAIPASVYKPMIKGTVFFIGYNLVYGFFMPAISNSAHIGGLVCGIIMGLALAQSLDPETRQRRLGWSVAASLGLMILFIGIGWLMLFTMNVPASGYSSTDGVQWFDAKKHYASREEAMKAVQGYRKDAERGDAIAQYNLGVMYKEGLGVAKDEFEAVRWFQKAAGQGFTQAQYMLGICYITGQGISKNAEVGVMWIEKSASQGNEDARALLKKLDNPN